MSVDVLKALSRHRRECDIPDCEWCQELDEVSAAVSELMEAVEDVYCEPKNAGDHRCDPGCMSCRIQKAIFRARGGAVP